jgi:hypothetical protein
MTAEALLKTVFERASTIAKSKGTAMFYSENTKLANWVANQRIAHVAPRRKPIAYDALRIQALESLVLRKPPSAAGM